MNQKGTVINVKALTSTFSVFIEISSHYLDKWFVFVKVTVFRYPIVQQSKYWWCKYMICFVFVMSACLLNVPRKNFLNDEFNEVRSSDQIKNYKYKHLFIKNKIFQWNVTFPHMTHHVWYARVLQAVAVLSGYSL